VHWPLRLRPLRKRLLPLGLVSGNGLRATDLSRESARGLDVFACGRRQAAPRRAPYRRGALDSEGRRLLVRLANLCQLRAKVDCDRASAVCQRADGRRSRTVPVCSGVDHRRLVLALFPWVRFQRLNAAVKMHTLLDLRGNIPMFLRVTDGKVHGVNMLDKTMLEAGVSISRIEDTSTSSGFSCLRSARL
jgi:hypothetical protein